MIRNIHQNKYSQLIPGINRTDGNIKFTLKERCISQHGDGFPHTQTLLAEAYDAHQRGRHTKHWNESLNKVAEKSIAEALRAKENKVNHWKELLNKEVDSLAKEIEKIDQCDQSVLRKKEYFSNLFKTSQMTSEYRMGIPDCDSNDTISDLQKQELGAICKADDDVNQSSKDLKDCARNLKNVRDALMSEVQAKAQTLNINKRCQHSEPLLNFLYVPTNDSLDQAYNPSTEEEWENNLDRMIKNSSEARQEASKIRCRVEMILKSNLSSTADAWHKTTKALIEAVQLDERSVFNIKVDLKRIGENIDSTHQRIASLSDDLRVQDRGRTLQQWRLQTMGYRPEVDRIRDEPMKKLEEEMSNIETKNAFIVENQNRSRDLLPKLIKEKQKQTLELENLTKKLFIERENCLGLRRTVLIEDGTHTSIE